MLAAAIVLVFMVLLGAFSLACQVYKLVVADAESRGLKHPKLWGLFSLSGNNGTGGLLLYLLGRNKYPAAPMAPAAQAAAQAAKRKAALSLGFTAAGGMGLVCLAVWGGL